MCGKLTYPVPCGLFQASFSRALQVRTYLVLSYPSVRPFVRPVVVFGKVPHVALVRWDSFDEGLCGCFGGALQGLVAKGRILRRFKMDQKG